MTRSQFAVLFNSMLPSALVACSCTPAELLGPSKATRDAIVNDEGVSLASLAIASMPWGKLHAALLLRMFREILQCGTWQSSQ